MVDPQMTDAALIEGKTRARWRELARMMAFIALLNIGGLGRLDTLAGTPSWRMAITSLNLFALIVSGFLAWRYWRRSQVAD
jgi:hypothetical protein